LERPTHRAISPTTSSVVEALGRVHSRHEYAGDVSPQSAGDDAIRADKKRSHAGLERYAERLKTAGASASNPGAMMPSQTTPLSKVAVARATLSEMAKPPNEDFGSVPRARASASAAGVRSFGLASHDATANRARASRWCYCERDAQQLSGTV